MPVFVIKYLYNRVEEMDSLLSRKEHFFLLSVAFYRLVMTSIRTLRLLIPSFIILGECRMRIRQLSRISGTSSNNFIKSRMKTTFSEAICIIETCNMEIITMSIHRKSARKEN